MIDQTSQDFIKWSKEKLEDPEYFESFIREMKNKMESFYSNSPEYIKAKLYKKLVRGSEEHGNPDGYSPEDIKRELEFEFIDIIGWSLVGMWNEERYGRENSSTS